jgi:hypothetical protein
MNIPKENSPVKPDNILNAPNGDGADLSDPQHTVPSESETSDRPHLVVINAASVKRKRLEWLWPGWLPLGKMFVLDGDPNLGKSTVLLDLAARVSTHGVMPDGQPGITGGVIIMSAEDEIEDTMIPRLLAAGANLDRIVFYEGIRQGHLEEPPTIPHSLHRIEELAKKTNARLIVIDPLMAYLDAESNNDQSVRKALHPVKTMAGRQRCTVGYLRHLNKGNSTKAIYRGGGSIAIIGAARSGALVAQHPQLPDRKVFAHSKFNLSIRQQSLMNTLDYDEAAEACRVNWLDERCQLTADDLLKAPGSPEDRSDLDEAMVFLREVLADGPLASNVVYALGKEAGLKDYTLRKAQAKAGVKCEAKRSPEGAFLGWFWRVT